MIPKINRFHGYGSLRNVYKHGKTIRGPMMSVKYSLNQNRNLYRAAVVVSKKVDKSAVARNRIRRRLYETLRSYSKKIDQPYDIVITVFSESISQLTQNDLDKMIYTQLKQARIIK